MFISPPTTDRLIQGLQKRGVPPYLFRHPGAKIEDLIRPIPVKKGEVSKQMQRSGLVECAKAPIAFPYLYVIAGHQITENAGLVALSLAVMAIKRHNLPPARWPWWHRILPTGRDVLLERKAGFEMFGQPAILVIDGLVEESNILKLERARDILQIYSHRPRILLLSGVSNPIAYTQNKLRLAASRYLLLADTNLIVKTV